MWNYVDSNDAYNFFLLKTDSYWYVWCVYKNNPAVWELQGFPSKERAEEQIAHWKMWMQK